MKECIVVVGEGSIFTGSRFVQELIRCKDCKWRGNPLSCKLESEGMYPDPDWFCADGEKTEKHNSGIENVFLYSQLKGAKYDE